VLPKLSQIPHDPSMNAYTISINWISHRDYPDHK